MKPNILFITTDQQNCNTLSCYGGQNIFTPNIDHLAEEGVLLGRAYVTCPLCVPSRGSILFGKYPHTTGIAFNDDGREITEHRHMTGLSDILSQNGYECAYFGKWHLGHENEAQHGFNAGWEVFLRESYEEWLAENHKFVFPGNLTVHRRAVVPYELAHDTHVAEKTIDFLQKTDRARPFALWCAFRAPHDPYVGPMTDYYKKADMAFPKSIHDNLSGKPYCQTNNWSAKYRDHIEHIETTDDYKDTIARYQGLSKFVDINAGKVLDMLDQLGLKENTIVVFHSDHGDMMGAHNLICKGPYMYEETTRVPFIIRYPEIIPAGKRMEGLFSLVDIAPTILELLNIKHDEYFDGLSAAAAIKKAAPHFRQAVFSEIFEILDQRAVIFSVRTEKWKYNMYLGDMDELYDMELDPYEMHNLAEKPEMVNTIKQMQSHIQKWLVETNGIHIDLLFRAGEKNRPMNFLSKEIVNMGFRSV